MKRFTAAQLFSRGRDRTRLVGPGHALSTKSEVSLFLPRSLQLPLISFLDKIRTFMHYAGVFFLGLVISANCFFGMSATAQTSNMDESAIQQRARELAHRFIITDGHVDLPYRLRVRNFRLSKEFIGIPIETEQGDFDYVRAKEGGLDAPFMSIYIPASRQLDGTAKVFADSLIDMVRGIAAAHPDKFGLAGSPAEVEANFKLGVVSLPMGMENGAPIMDDLANVRYFHERGIRYITLTHSKDNQICDSSYDTTGTWQGLSPFGREVVREMNKVGIMVDISHVSDNTFYQVIDLTEAPVIASHSSCRKFTPGFERNMSDDMIRKLGENGGVIQINFGSTFLDGAVADYRAARRGADEPDEPVDPELMFSDVQRVADHIDHVVALAGIDHVGLGSDFDGVGDSLPRGLKDVSAYPNLIAELLRRGYSDEDIEKVCYKNVFRVWRAVEEVARRM